MRSQIATAQHIANRVAAGEREFGRVACKEEGEYVLLTYTPEAQHDGNFTPIEAACRGLVVSIDGKIAALPMPKFFNLGEPQCPALPDERYTVWEKVDGSLGIFWHDGDAWRCNTRGSFDNLYIRFAMDWWKRNIPEAFDMIPRHWTLMVEICIDDDDMKRAAYKPEDIYLIAIRDNYSGADLSLLSGTVWNTGLPTMMPAADLIQLGIDELVDQRKEATGIEGWVVRFESGLRVKIKTDWYLRLFRAIQALTPKHVRELMIDAGEDWIDEFPDDLKAEAIEIQEVIETRLQTGIAEVYSVYSRLADIQSRKDYALAVLADYAHISSWLFNMRDDKFSELEFLKRLRI